MNKPIDVFIDIPCLTEMSHKLSGIEIQKKWFKKADKRYLSQYLQKFIEYNREYFEFLNITPFLIGSDQNSAISFRTSQYIGSIPLRSPDTGKQIGDFVISPRFIGKNKFEDYIEILNLLEDNILSETIDSLPLVSGRNFQPPFYLEASKFIRIFEKLSRQKWLKFNSANKVTNTPIGQINWKKYIDNAYKTENLLRFPVRKNLLNEYHNDYSMLKYVFEICKKEILSFKTPLSFKYKLKSAIDNLENNLYLHSSLQTKFIPIRSSDSPLVKKCKTQANSILSNNFSRCTAWRVNYSDVFEKYVQHILQLATNIIGGILKNNSRISGYSSFNFSWALQYLEPDSIFYKDSLAIMIDAKYKANLYNKMSSSKTLKEDHRKDIHQLLCYNSFTSSNLKHGFLCYPADNLIYEELKYKNHTNGISNIVHVFGIPLSIKAKTKSIQLFMNKLSEIEKENWQMKKQSIANMQLHS